MSKGSTLDISNPDLICRWNEDSNGIDTSALLKINHLSCLEKLQFNQATAV